jgi:hypothetical protein
MGGDFGHGHGHGHGHHFRGPIIEFFGDPYYAYDDGYYGYRYGNGCGYYRAKWHDTGRRYWLRRYEQCLEGWDEVVETHSYEGPGSLRLDESRSEPARLLSRRP